MATRSGNHFEAGLAGRRSKLRELLDIRIAFVGLH